MAVVDTQGAVQRAVVQALALALGSTEHRRVLVLLEQGRAAREQAPAVGEAPAAWAQVSAEQGPGSAGT